MNASEYGQELIGNLTKSPRSDRLLLRNQLGTTYEKASIKAKFAFLNVVPIDVLNMHESYWKLTLMNALFFTSSVFSVWHTEEFYQSSNEKKRFEEMLAILYNKSDTESSKKRIEDLLNMHTGNATFLKALGNYIRQFRNNPKMNYEIDEISLAEDLIFWDSNQESWVDSKGIERSGVAVQEKWANTIVKYARVKENKK